MSQTKAPESTPSPQSSMPKAGGDNKSPNRIFVIMALDMSWRLAGVVIIPIVAGFKLDERFESAPLLSILGFILAIGGIILVLRRTLQEAGNVPIPKQESK